MRKPFVHLAAGALAGAVALAAAPAFAQSPPAESLAPRAQRGQAPTPAEASQRPPAEGLTFNQLALAIGKSRIDGEAQGRAIRAARQHQKDMDRAIAAVEQVLYGEQLAAFHAALAEVAPPPQAPKAPGKIEFRAENRDHKAVGTFHQWRFKHLVVPPDGDFEKGEAILEIDLASIDTGIARRDDHLRNPDFFDVDNFPKGTVEIVDVAADTEATDIPDGAKAYTATAKVSVLGMVRNFPVSFTVLDHDATHLHVSGTGHVTRSAFDMYHPYDPEDPRSITDHVPVTMDFLVPKDPPAAASSRALRETARPEVKPTQPAGRQ